MRLSERPRPSIHCHTFHRYGDQEKNAVASFSFLDDVGGHSEDEDKGPVNNIIRDKSLEDDMTFDLEYSPRTNLLGDSPTESTGSRKAPLPQNPAVLALKDENRREGKELKKSPLP